MVVSSDGRRAYIGSEGAITVFDLVEGKAVAEWREHDKCVLSLALSAEDRLLASGGEDGKLRVWDTLTGKLMATLPLVDPRSGYISRVDIAPKGDRVAALLKSSGGGELKDLVKLEIWDVNPAKKHDGYAPLPNGYHHVRFVGGGSKWVYSDAEAKLIAWMNPQVGAAHTTMARDRDSPNWYTFDVTPDGSSILATEGNARFGIWDLKSGKLVHSEPLERFKTLEDITLSRNGRYAVLMLDDKIKVFKLPE